MILVDENKFSDIYIYYKEHKQNSVEYEANEKNKQFYNKISAFYKDLKGSDKQMVKSIIFYSNHLHF